MKTNTRNCVTRLQCPARNVSDVLGAPDESKVAEERVVELSRLRQVTRCEINMVHGTAQHEVVTGDTAVQRGASTPSVVTICDALQLSLITMIATSHRKLTICRKKKLKRTETTASV